MKTHRNSILSVLTLGLISIAGSALAGGVAPQHAGGPLSTSEAQRQMQMRPLEFVQNAGQWDSRAQYQLRADGLDYWVTSRGFVLDFHAPVPSAKLAGHAVAVEMVGAKPSAVRGAFRRDATRDFIRLGEKTNRAQVFGEVISSNLYPGVTLRSYIEGRSPRYDFIVAPKADASVIQLAFRGADVRVAKDGALELKTQVGIKRIGDLTVYTERNGEKTPVDAKFVEVKPDVIAFRLGAYDKSAKLVIDPLIYGSYYGGDNGPDAVQAVVTDTEGGVYYTGKTRASQFPAIFGPYGFNLRGGDDAFITKLQGDAYSHDYAALFGGGRNDEGTRIQVDPLGNVFVAGLTFSLDFPGNTRDNIQLLSLTSTDIPTGGTFFLTLNNQRTVDLPFDASPADVQTALEAIVGVGNIEVTLKAGSGNLSTGAIYKVRLPRSIPGVVGVNNEGMEPIYRIAEGVEGLTQVFRQVGTTAPTGGFYRLGYKGNFTPPIAWNANATIVRNNLATLPGLNAPGAIDVISAQAPANPSTPPYVFLFNVPDDPNPTVEVDNAPMTGGTYEVVTTDSWFVFWDPGSTRPSGGFFTMTHGADTAGFNWNANGEALRVGLNALPSIGDNNTIVRSFFGNFLPDAFHQIIFVGERAGNSLDLSLDDEGLRPKPTYGIRIPSDIFVLRFAKQGNSLNPLPTQSLIFGSDGDDTLAGFSIKPVETPIPGEPTEFILAGNNEFDITNIPTAFTGNQSYFARYLYTDSYNVVPAASNYFSDGRSTVIGGAVLDAEGNMVIGGQVNNSGNIDTSVTAGVFDTSSNAFEGGRLLRNSDLFVRKFNSAGARLYSVLIGGNNGEITGGFLTDMTGRTFNVGSTVAVDPQGNAYITGVTNSFNYPRTRGVFGEVFGNSNIVVVTKINSDGSQVLYSTNLRTANGARGAASVRPAGIAVDLAGNAHITGNLRPYSWFPENNGADPADPNRPVETGNGTIPTTDNGLDLELTMPDVADLPTNEGFYLVLNNTATNLLYGSYVGGILDDFIHGPYVDSFGDSWVVGSTDVFRRYVLFSSTGDPTIVETDGATLPDTMITPLAFKANPDAAGPFTVSGVQYGLNQPNPFLTILAWNPSDTAPFQPIPTVNTTNRRDGFIQRLRVAFPSAASLLLAPNTVPGGLGASTTATFTLSAPAPTGGADIVATISNGAIASFDAQNTVTTLEFTIPAGETTATFPVFSRGVTANAAVDVRATYLGSFKIARLNVIPWLQQLGLTPSEVVGGNNSSGRITLAAPAPTGGVTIDLLTDAPSLVSFPNGATVTIPAGQQTGTFPITTQGVPATRFPKVTASLLGVGRTQTLTVQPVTVSSVSFSPNRIAAGNTTTGTVTFNGAAGAAGRVRVRLNSGTPGYRFRLNASSAQVGELFIPVTVGARSVTFLLDTAIETVNAQRIATATQVDGAGAPIGTSASGTIFVDAINLTAFTISPAAVDGGTSATGAISINAPAPEGGVTIRIETGNPTIATAPATVTIPSGATQASFDIPTSVVFGKDQVASFAAKRGAASIGRKLTVRATAFNFTLDPTTVVGGVGNSTGTITLGAPAPTGGLPIRLASDNTAAATVPSSVTVPAGETTVTFPITSRGVALDLTANITATYKDVVVTRTLFVTATRLSSISVSPNQLRPFRSAVATVRLANAAPAGGVQVRLVMNTALFAVFPTSLTVTVPAGATSVTFPLQAKQISVPTRTTIRAEAGGSSVATLIDILR